MSQHPDDDPLIKRTLVQKDLGDVSADTMRQLEDLGHLHPIRLGASKLPHVFYRASEVRRLKQHGVPTAPAEPTAPVAPRAKLKAVAGSGRTE